MNENLITKELSLKEKGNEKNIVLLDLPFGVSNKINYAKERIYQTFLKLAKI